MNKIDRQSFLSEGMQGDILTLTLGGGIAHALSAQAIAELHDAVRRAGADDAVGAVIIHGPGRIFCAGHDLKEIARHRSDTDQGRAYLDDLFAACGAMMQDLTMLPKTTIAMVEGLATAAGLQLVAACDMALAAPGAKFCLPGVRNAGFCTTPAVAVGRAIGQRKVTEMALTGADFDADWALQAGLINRIVPAENLAGETRALATHAAGHFQPALGLGKQTLHRQLDLPLDEAYALATEVMVQHFMDPERIRREQQA